MNEEHIAFLRTLVIEGEFGDSRPFESLRPDQQVWVDEHLDDKDEEIRVLLAEARAEFGYA